MNATRGDNVIEQVTVNTEMTTWLGIEPYGHPEAYEGEFSLSIHMLFGNS